ncbi:hypothetical protein VNO80_06340 [Phaseolus coccineus]|uniref:Uncharacterized protein n=1 Tax=Phaseolus coccineus TaxID=3886 RepID=A0AAN9RIM7_PHACN
MLCCDRAIDGKGGLDLNGDDNEMANSRDNNDREKSVGGRLTNGEGKMGERRVTDSKRVIFMKELKGEEGEEGNGEISTISKIKFCKRVCLSRCNRGGARRRMRWQLWRCRFENYVFFE